VVGVRADLKLRSESNMNRDTTPTIIPPSDAQLGAFERLAAKYPGESVYAKWQRQQERVAILAARRALRNVYASRGNHIAMREVEMGSVPAVLAP
jgi:hypothetical protein